MVEQDNTLSVGGPVWEDESFVRSYLKMERKLLAKKLLYTNVLSFLPALAPQRDQVILDVGSGLSTIAGEVGHRGFGYIGIDLSHQMLGIANKINQVDRVDDPRKSFIQTDIKKGIPLRDGSVAGVVGVNVLYNFTLEELESVVLPEIARVTSSGGIFVITNPLPEANNIEIIKEEARLRGGGIMELIGLALDIFHNRDFLRHQGQLAKDALKLHPDQWVELLSRHGFTQSPEIRLAYAGQASIVSARKE